MKKLIFLFISLLFTISVVTAQEYQQPTPNDLCIIKQAIKDSVKKSEMISWEFNERWGKDYKFSFKGNSLIYEVSFNIRSGHPPNGSNYFHITAIAEGKSYREYFSITDHYSDGEVDFVNISSHCEDRWENGQDAYNQAMSDILDFFGPFLIR